MSREAAEFEDLEPWETPESRAQLDAWRPESSAIPSGVALERRRASDRQLADVMQRLAARAVAQLEQDARLRNLEDQVRMLQGQVFELGRAVDTLRAGMRPNAAFVRELAELEQEGPAVPSVAPGYDLLSLLEDAGE